MSAKIYLEGGGDSKELRTRCREGFRRLLEKCNFHGRMPQLVACGGRSSTFDDFSIAHANAKPGDYVAMLIDSEDPMADIDQTWTHLKARTDDDWDRPAQAEDEQVLMMTTCMETWIIADRNAIQAYFGQKLHEKSLPNLRNLEARPRDKIQNALVQASRNCQKQYAKGKTSFEILTTLDPAAIKPHLPSFVRCLRVLEKYL